MRPLEARDFKEYATCLKENPVLAASCFLVRAPLPFCCRNKIPAKIRASDAFKLY